MFVDASAFAAVLLGEDDRDAYLERLYAAPLVLVSPLSTWETVRACVKERRFELEDARLQVSSLFAQLRASLVGIGEAERDAALDAYARFGKGRHRAKLNMGDCFAYACARTNSVPLLFKGSDFLHTDIERA